ncbi:hypothetical protein, partial [Phocaeicola barnesiae]|uniref:hypothetical protein n=1 Tax=Phocaeicola barnesiae TaxID=376804 RepID=UPI00242C51F2
IRISFLQCVSLSKAVAKVQTFPKPASIPRNFFETFSGINSQIPDKQKNKIQQFSRFRIKRSKNDTI